MVIRIYTFINNCSTNNSIGGKTSTILTTLAPMFMVKTPISIPLPFYYGMNMHLPLIMDLWTRNLPCYPVSLPNLSCLIKHVIISLFSVSLVSLGPFNPSFTLLTRVRSTNPLNLIYMNVLVWFLIGSCLLTVLLLGIAAFITWFFSFWSVKPPQVILLLLSLLWTITVCLLFLKKRPKPWNFSRFKLWQAVMLLFLH